MTADSDDLLAGLAAARLVDARLAFARDAAEALSLDEEAAALEALTKLAEGPIYRLAPFDYAFRAADELDALRAAFAAAAEGLAGAEAASLTPLDPPETPTPAPEALLLGAMAGAAIPGLPKLIVDAAPALAALDGMAARLTAAATAESDATAARLDAVESAARDAAEAAAAARDVAKAIPAPERFDPQPLLDAMAAESAARDEAAVAAATQAADRAAEALGARVDAQAEALAAFRGAAEERLDAALPTLERRLAGLETGLAASVSDALDARLTLIEERLAGLEDAAAGDRLAEIAQSLRRLSESVAPSGESRRERDALLRAASAMQTLLGRLDRAAARIEAGSEPEAVEDPPPESAEVAPAPPTEDAAAFEADRRAETAEPEAGEPASRGAGA